MRKGTSILKKTSYPNASTHFNKPTKPLIPARIANNAIKRFTKKPCQYCQKLFINTATHQPNCVANKKQCQNCKLQFQVRQLISHSSNCPGKSQFRIQSIRKPQHNQLLAQSVLVNSSSEGQQTVVQQSNNNLAQSQLVTDQKDQQLELSKQQEKQRKQFNEIKTLKQKKHQDRAQSLKPLDRVRPEWFRQPPKRTLQMPKQTQQQKKKRQEQNQRSRALQQRAQARKRQQQQALRIQRQRQRRQRQRIQQQQQQAQRNRLRQIQLQRQREQQRRLLQESQRQNQLQQVRIQFLGSQVLNTHINNLINSGIDQSNIPQIANHIQQLRALSIMMSQIDQGIMGNLGQIYRQRIRALQITLVNGIGQIILSHIHHQMIGMSRALQQPKGLSITQIQNLSKAKIARQTSGDCPICLMDIQKFQQIRQLPCKHSFHKQCIDQWLGKQSRCPKCRSKFK